MDKQCRSERSQKVIKISQDDLCGHIRRRTLAHAMPASGLDWSRTGLQLWAYCLRPAPSQPAAVCIGRRWSGTRRRRHRQPRSEIDTGERNYETQWLGNHNSIYLSISNSWKWLFHYETQGDATVYGWAVQWQPDHRTKKIIQSRLEIIASDRDFGVTGWSHANTNYFANLQYPHTSVQINGAYFQHSRTGNDGRSLLWSIFQLPLIPHIQLVVF